MKSLLVSRKDAFKIEKIENPLKQLTVTIKPKLEGKEYLLTGTLSSEAQSGYINGEVITIHTNNPDQPEIKIPVYALLE